MRECKSCLECPAQGFVSENTHHKPETVGSAPKREEQSHLQGKACLLYILVLWEHPSCKTMQRGELLLYTQKGPH
jgi:hypothetical protein